MGHLLDPGQRTLLARCVVVYDLCWTWLLHVLTTCCCAHGRQSSPRAGVAIGDKILDLAEVAAAGLFTGPLLKDKAAAVFSQV